MLFLNNPSEQFLTTCVWS